MEKKKKSKYQPNTAMGLKKYLSQFPDAESAREFVENWRWGGNVKCPRCDSAKVYKLSTKRSGFWHCNGCGKQFSVRTNSIFQNSRLGLDIWLHAMYIMVTARKGDSSMHLSKELGIMQRHAWFLEHRIREAMSSGKYDGLFKGIVEFDETYPGGKNKNRHAKKKLKGSGPANKPTVVGAYERSTGRCISIVAPDSTKSTLRGLVESLVEKNSIVSTDEYSSYRVLDKLGYDHKKANHKAKIFVDRMASTNGVESMWACLKRGFYGTFHKFSLKHLQRYVNDLERLI